MRAADLKPIELSLIEQALQTAPSRRVVDLGCGSGRHARLLAERGCAVVGIDASDEAIEEANRLPIPQGVEFFLGDMGAVEGAVRGQFGAAICLGNALAHLLTAESVSRMLIGLRRRLVPEAPFVLQLLNYDRIMATGSKHALPIEVYPAAPTRPAGPAGTSPDGGLIVLPLVEPRVDGIVTHTTTILRHRPAGDPVIEVLETSQSQLRGWQQEEIQTMLEVARWPNQKLYGDMSGGPFDRMNSLDIVIVAR